ncbi:MAG: hypothetical protein JXR94_23650, partial [Candidatus Hydrogenedentes bacterium]|nr:hypothetical protein [Candidatus Hydrogenedentota bacterium]
VVLPRPARLLLAAALAQNTQDLDRVALYLNEAPSEPFTISEQDGTLNSDIRNAAIELLVLRQTGKNAAELAEMAEELFAFLRDRRHGTTQETAFVVTALSAYLSDLEANIDGAGASVSGSATGALQGGEVFRAAHDGAGGSFTIANTGTADLFVNVTSRGVPAQPAIEPVSEGIAITRTFRTPKGEPHDGAFEQASAYVVDLSINCAHDAKNVAVADLLPAGFEIENPRLEADAAPGAGFKGAATPAYLEIRDDRLVLAFECLEQGPHHFYYVVRAVTPGRFQHPPVTAECMYDARVRGASAPSAVDVKE